MEAITSGKYSDILITAHCWKTKQAKEVDKKEEAAHQKHERERAKSILPVYFICIVDGARAERKMYMHENLTFALAKNRVSLRKPGRFLSRHITNYRVQTKREER
jgi:hypothetical protein